MLLSLKSYISFDLKPITLLDAANKGMLALEYCDYGPEDMRYRIRAKEGGGDRWSPVNYRTFMALWRRICDRH